MLQKEITLSRAANFTLGIPEQTDAPGNHWGGEQEVDWLPPQMHLTSEKDLMNLERTQCYDVDTPRPPQGLPVRAPRNSGEGYTHFVSLSQLEWSAKHQYGYCKLERSFKKNAQSVPCANCSTVDASCRFTSISIERSSCRSDWESKPTFSNSTKTSSAVWKFAQKKIHKSVSMNRFGMNRRVSTPTCGQACNTSIKTLN